MPSQKKLPVMLTEADRKELVRVTRTGVHPASVIRRARVLLALDTSSGEVDSQEVIAARLIALACSQPPSKLCPVVTAVAGEARGADR
ncbi:hypothetical protein [Streptomyces sp. 6N223]|uniref:hypothetical protein n=1 Tax=Streptomyces sp. 6N223 TaxID=3457412 RepID=UPI003FD5CBCB